MRAMKVAVAMVLGVCAAAAWAAGANPEAIKWNNRGVALMGQQFTEKAADAFAQARKADPMLAQAAVNQGIALATLQKMEEARAALEAGIKLDASNPQAWYNLGLVEHSTNELEAALASFEQAAKLDPRDADSIYFVGVCYGELKQFDKAVVEFERVLAINSLHASAEFQLARALQRSGRTAEVKEHFRRFEHIQKTKIGSPIGQAYGEQGHYSTVTPVEEPEERQPAMIPVRMEARPLIAAKGVWTTTGAACMIDATGSGVFDLVLPQAGAEALKILHPNGDGSWTELNAAQLGLKLGGKAVGCAVGDWDNDYVNDLAVALEDRVVLYRNTGKGKFEDATEAAGLKPLDRPTGLTFLDYDHDGVLDLFVTGAPLAAGGQANLLWRNNGNKTFTDKTEATGFGGAGKTSAAILTDFNNDRAVDVAVTGDGAAPLIYVNPREGKYPTQALYEASQQVSGSASQQVSKSASQQVSKSAGQQVSVSASQRGIAVLDFDKDGWMDLAVTHAGAPGLTLWRNVAAADGMHRRFERVALPLVGATGGWGLTPVDIDNDGWIDLAAIVETKAGPRVRVFRNRADGTFEDVSKVLGLDAIKLTAPRGLLAVEGDGATDLIVTQQNAAPVLLHNVGANKNHMVRLDLTGFADNKTALGAKVEIFAAGHWQKWELAGAAGYQTQTAPRILAGLGAASGIDLLRILWPTGVLQDEIDLPQTPVVAMKEADRRGSSCPVVFAWDGHKYRFVTDTIGAAVVGHWFTPERRNTPNAGEWIKVTGEQLQPEKGRLSLRFIEPMEEVNYIDKLKLVAVDHPADVEVNPDERFLDAPPFASGRVIASRGAHLPVGAWDGAGRDAMAEISKRDHKFASGFTATPFDGFANLHALTLDLGPLDAKSPVKLLMTGYVNYFSATSLYAAWQAGIKETPPYVEAEMPDGSWQRVMNEAGFPAGQERTIVVDLTGKLPAGARRVRLMSNLEIYWDQVLVDNNAEAQARATEVPVAAATERFRGYPKQIDLASFGDLDYDYDRVSLTGPFQHQRGNYTRMGDVTELVKGVDNKYAIFGSGEEIAIEFDARALPALPAGWTRDYLFYANGYVKDMDWWDASPYTVAQLPFHEMSKYPYPAAESFPDDDAAMEYQLNYNDRFDSGEPDRAYRFQYRDLHATPAGDGAWPYSTGARP